MPNRILKESICKSDTINTLTWEEEVFFYRLLTACDDYGRYDSRPSVIRGWCFPLRLESVTDSMVDKWLRRLADVGLLQLYAVEGKGYLQVATWREHQQVRATKSKYPPPPAIEVKPLPLKTPDINCNQPTSDEINGKQMSPYSYSYSKSDIRESDSIPAEQQTVRQKLDIFRVWLQENCDKALYDPMVLDNRWGRYLVEGFEVETIKLAIMDAADHGAGNKPKYICRILDNWRSSQAFKVDDAQALLDARTPNKSAATPKPVLGNVQKYRGVDPDDILN